MRLSRLSIRNYKSLRDVSISPTPLSVLIGPNAAGKSNFADAILFLSEVYISGLETAVARKGGYENIAHRKQRRSKAPMSFEIIIDVDWQDVLPPLTPRKLNRHYDKERLKLAHRFSIVATGGGIKAAFKVDEETFSVYGLPREEPDSQSYMEVMRYSRSSDGKTKFDLLKEGFIEDTPLGISNSSLRKTIFERIADRNYPEQELIIKDVNYGNRFSSLVSSFKAYQFSTTWSRHAGVPTPNPSLSSTGENLPALVDWLQRKHPNQWNLALSGMKEILPDLEAISVQYLHTKTLGLFFNEVGFGRPWSVEDVSDGTMHALAMLVAAVDPRTTLLLIEEPENSIHPWILRVIMDRLREVSNSKNVILTSHSMTLTNRVRPEEVWVIYRKNGESNIQKLTDIYHSIEDDWENGEFQLAEFLDSGAIGQAVPGGVW